jgi:hypothetical protein
MGVTAGIFLASILLKEMRYLVYTAISIKVAPSKAEKSDTSAKGCWESLKTSLKDNGNENFYWLFQSYLTTEL